MKPCDANSTDTCQTSGSGVLKAHWNKVYEHTDKENLGWYEPYAEPSLRLIEQCDLPKDARMLHVGAGVSTLIDELLEQGYQNIIVNDLSQKALEKLRTRLDNPDDYVEWIADDLTQPFKLKTLAPVDLWHDRAVLHFFTEENQIITYFDLLKKLVKPNGYVIIATFRLNGATRCSGLPVHHYNSEILQQRLGENFTLLDTFNYTFTMPSGDTRPYVYTLFQRVDISRN